MSEKIRREVPKGIEEMGMRLYLGNDPKPSEIEWRPGLIHGRFVPDDLLRERFAFAGSVVISHENLKIILLILNNLLRYAKHEHIGDVNNAILFIESKFTPPQSEEEKGCEHRWKGFQTGFMVETVCELCGAKPPKGL